MIHDMTLPPPLFDLEQLAQDVDEQWWGRVVQLHVIHSPDLDLDHWCADDRYGYLDGVPARRDAWVWHCCTQPVDHDGPHKCDRCEHMWTGAPTHVLLTVAAWAVQ